MASPIRLRVVEANLSDVGRGIARIDPNQLEILGLVSGDIIELQGLRKTTAKIWPDNQSEPFKNYIKIDGMARTNAGTRLDDYVQIKKATVVIASKVIMTPSGMYQLKGAEVFFKRELLGRPISVGDKVRMKIMQRKIEYSVSRVFPDLDTVLVEESTEVILEKERRRKRSWIPGFDEIFPPEVPVIGPRIRYEDIGGLDDVVKKLRETIELPLRYPFLFARLGIHPPKGILLYGPPGTGKTILAKAIAVESKSNFIEISGSEILSKYYGESEKRLREVFEEAKRKGPSIIFIDDIDSMVPKRKDSSGELEKRIVSQLVSLMDEFMDVRNVAVIGATNQINDIDSALRRPGRFDRELEVRAPNINDRHEILLIHTRSMPLSENVDLRSLAEKTHGFVGADIVALTKEAAMSSIRRLLPEREWDRNGVPPEIISDLQVTMDDFLSALDDIHPTAMREISIDIPNVKWEDVGGLDNQVRELQEAIEWPVNYPSLFKYTVSKPPKGILLFGAPGTGKTLLVKAVATESQLNLISVKGSEVLSKWVGESERGIREIFRKARQAAPCVVFFDEIDAIAPSRGSGDSTKVTERVISALLTEIDGLEELKNVFIVAATNRPDIIDPALMRSGRFDRLIYLPIPSYDARVQIFKIQSKNKPLSSSVDLTVIAKKVKGFSGADIENVLKEASMLAIRQFIKKKMKNKAKSDETVKKLIKTTKFRITKGQILSAIAKLGNPSDNEENMASRNFAKQRGILILEESKDD